MDDEEKLRVSALMLYFAEGTKKGRNVDFTNSNILMVKIWLKFLKKICKVDVKRIKFQLHLHYDMDEEDIRKWWSKNLNVPQENFTKSYIKKVKKKGTYKAKSEIGTIKVRYSSKSLLDNINNQIGTVAQNLTSR
jgi:hypothetical protein